MKRKTSGFSSFPSFKKYICTFQIFHLSEDDLHSLCLNGVDAAFIPQAEKQILRQELQKELDVLKGKLACQ